MADISYKKIMEGEDEENNFLPAYRQMLTELIKVKREVLKRLRKEHLYSDEMIRSKEWELDLEEARLNES